MGVDIRELSDNELKAFVKFPFTLYKKSKQWVPPIIKDEVSYLDRRRNTFFKNVEMRYFAAYKNSKMVGRIAAIINNGDILDRGKVRFGWFDFVDDLGVSRALINRISELGVSKNLEYLEGPMGVSVIDKAGMLTMGFELRGKASTLYNYDYYPKHMEKLGFETQKKWVEYKISVPDDYSRLQKISEIVRKKMRLTKVSLGDKKTITGYAQQIFEVLNASFKDLSTFTKMESHHIEYYKKKYANFIHSDYISLQFNQDGKMIGFGVTIPDISEALQKANGRLFPFGMFYILRAFKKAKKADLTLIGVHPDYQNKGLTAVIFEEIIASYKRIGVTHVEVGPGLEENTKYHDLWKGYDTEVTRHRSTFKKYI